MIVVWIAGLKIGRHVLGIDPRQVLFKKRHAEAASPVFVRCPQEAQIVVRLMPRMSAAEAVQHLTNVRRPGTHEVL